MQNSNLDLRGYEGARASLQQGLEYIPPNDSEGKARLYHKLGRTHFSKGYVGFWQENRQDYHSYFNKAKKAYQQALAIFTEEDYPEARLEVLGDYIRLLYTLDKPERAEGLQIQAANILETLLNSSKKSHFQTRQLALKFYNIRQLGVQTLIRQQQFSQALTNAELDKNGSLQWLLQREWSSPNPSHHLSFDEVQKQLPPNSAVIYWYLTPVALNTFIITPNHPPQLLETENLNSQTRFQHLEQLRDFLQQWREQQKEQPQQWQEQLPQRLDTLKTLLNIPKLLNRLPSNLKQLILVPHRDLHRLPLHALFLDYLDSSVSLCYLPSLQTQFAIQQTLNRTSQNSYDFLTLQGNSERLPLVEIECSHISEHFQSPSLLNAPSVEQAISFDTFTTTLQQTQGVLHYCGHAQHNHIQPSQSQLEFYLSLETNQPHCLTAEQIYQIDCNNLELVVLNGCETGITGTEEIETEYVGLGSVFLSCGVNFVVSTLWSVSDLMAWMVVKEFYRQLVVEKQPPPIAWRVAVEWLKGMSIEQFRETTPALKKALQEEETPIREEYKRLQRKQGKARRQGNHEQAQQFKGSLKQLDEQKNQLKSLKETIQKIENQTEGNQKPFSHPSYWSGLICQGI